MWSCGCIFAELFIRKPLLPGESFLNQLIRMISLVGTPDINDLRNIQSDRARRFIMNMAECKPQDFNEIFINASP